MVTLTPKFSTIASFYGLATRSQLLAETGMYAADESFARRHGGAITNRVLDAVPAWYREEAQAVGLELNIDVRIHDLKAGWFPAAPGWHCDAAVRETAFDDAAEKRTVDKNLVACVSTFPTGVSNTVFLGHAITLPGVSYEEAVANNSSMLNEALQGTAPDEEVSTRDGALTLFDPYTPHRVEMAKRDGVRLFMRISLWVPPEGHQPGLTKTEQVFFEVTQSDIN